MSKELIEYMTKALVEHPEEVNVEEVEDDRGAIINLSVAESDLGRVIGRNGRTAKAMRAILSVASTRSDRQCLLKILE